MHIIGIRLDGGKENVIKNLQPGWYPFGNFVEPVWKIIMNGVSQDQWLKTYIRPVIHCQEP